MLPRPKPYLTPEEYLTLERQAETKSEYWNGEMYAMAGASRTHSTIVTNVVGGLGGQLEKRPCEIYSNDMRVKVRPSGLYTYPDVVIVCEKAQFEDRHEDTLLNPTVIVEVLSPSTETYDRGAKFEFYSTLASLSDYLLVAQDRPFVGHHVRQPDGKWLLREYEGLDAIIHIASIGCDLPLIKVYNKVTWPEVEKTPKGLLRLVKEPGAEYLARPGPPTGDSVLPKPDP